MEPRAMPDLSNLRDHAARLEGVDLLALIDAGGARDEALKLNAAGITLDVRKQRLDLDALGALQALLADAGFEAARAALFAGEIVNPSEARPALHPALRNPDRLSDPAIAERLKAARAKTRAFAEACAQDGAILDGHPVRRVINIGIGGSDLGPRLVYDALKAFRRAEVDLRFVSNLDPADLDDALEGAEPETTLVCVTSKSFTTQETLMNAEAARDRLAAQLGADGAARRFAAATAAPDKAAAFGIDPARIFPFEAGVGGRYSLWSAAGLCLEIALGPEAFARLLAGARGMDDHFRTAPITANLPALKALIDVWNRAGRGLPARCVAAYSSRLALFPAYLQQLEMESLGKGVTVAGEPLTPPAGGALVWGGKGSDVQHSFFQWLHQGLDEVPVDFIGLGEHAALDDPRARALSANLFAQSAALAAGRPLSATGDPHKAMPGGRASAILWLDALEPEALGALIALFEHKVFAEALLYGINPFDQWGVELGKTLANAILSGETDRFDAATRDWLSGLGFKPGA